MSIVFFPFICNFFFLRGQNQAILLTSALFLEGLTSQFYAWQAHFFILLKFTDMHMQALQNANSVHVLKRAPCTISTPSEHVRV